MRKQYKKIKNESDARKYRRRLAIRKKISGSAERPRVCLVKSNAHISVQVIDDVNSRTLVALNTFGKNSPVPGRANTQTAKAFGIKLAESMKGKGITQAVFDRNGVTYTGILKIVGDQLRENGIGL